jgi:hypothetical protein
MSFFEQNVSQVRWAELEPKSKCKEIDVHQEQAKPTAQKCSDIAEEVDPAVKRCRMVWQIYSLIKVHELQPLIAKVKFHGVISVYAAKFASEVFRRSCTFEVPKMF